MKEDTLYNKIVSEDLTWEGLIREIVREEGLDPWNIDIKELTDRYVSVVNKSEKADMVLSGKFVLAASILLEMKVDNMFSISKPEKEMVLLPVQKDEYEIKSRVPQPKKRKVSLPELVDSLKDAMKVEKRRQKRDQKKKQSNFDVEVDREPFDIGEKMGKLYEKISEFFQNLKKEKLKFSFLTPSDNRKDVIYTFIPLIYLSNDGKVSLEQEKDFSEIYVQKEQKFDEERGETDEISA